MHKSTVLTALIGATIFLSCHKNSDHPASNSSCKLTGLQAKGNGWTGNYIITYGSDGKLGSVQYSDGSTSYKRTFGYASGMVIVNITGTSPGVDTVFLNGNGDVDHIIIHDASNNVTVESFTYDGNRQLTTSTTQVIGGGTIVATYQYNNGDITEADLGASKFIYAYDMDKASSASDLFIFGQWMQFGVIYQKARHLSKSLTAGGVTENLVYTFDGGGKITGATESSGSSDLTTFAFTYDCN